MAGTFRQLEVFVAVCEHGSFSAAADAIGISQAAVSRHVSALERAVGKHLFQRSAGRANPPSDAGRAVLDHALQVLESGRQIGHVARRQRRRIRVGADQMILNLILLPARDALHAAFADLDIDLLMIEPGFDPVEDMRRNDLDLLHFTEGPDEPVPAVARRVSTHETALFIARAALERLSATEPLPVVLPPAGSRTAEGMTRLLDRRLARPFHVAAHVEPAAVPELVMAGLGASMLNRRRAEALAGAGLLCPVPDFAGPVTLGRYQIMRPGADHQLDRVATHIAGIMASHPSALAC